MAKGLGRITGAFKQITALAGLREEVDELRKLLFDRRRPRIAVIGSSSQESSRLLTALLGATPADLNLDSARGSWVQIDAPGRKLEWLEVDPKGIDESNAWRDALTRQAPDLVLLVTSAERAEGEFDSLKWSWERVTTWRQGETALPRTLAVLLQQGTGSFAEERAHAVRKGLAERLRESSLNADPPRVVSLDDGKGMASLAEAILSALPYAARVEGARTLTLATIGRRRVAKDLVQACATVSVAVAVTPIPLSDMAVIGPLQVLMVSTVAYISGRSFSRKVLAEWLASLGVAGGAGFGLRWVAQQLAKFFPGAGNVVSASVAGAGTSAIGRSAMAYFLGKGAQTTDAS